MSRWRKAVWCSRPRSGTLQLHVRREADGTISGAAQMVPSAWGIEPLDGFFGPLELRDAVDGEVVLRLPGRGGRQE